MEVDKQCHVTTVCTLHLLHAILLVVCHWYGILTWRLREKCVLHRQGKGWFVSHVSLMADTLTDISADSNAAYGACVKHGLCTNSRSAIMLSAGLTQHKMLPVSFERNTKCAADSIYAESRADCLLNVSLSNATQNQICCSCHAEQNR